MLGRGGVLARWPNVRSRPERGAVAVEFALVMPILAMMLLGIVTTGLSYSNAIGVTNAVREGARFGATTGATPPAALPANWANDVIRRVRATQFDDPAVPPKLPETAVCVQLYKVAGGPVVTLCDQGNGSVVPALTMPDAGSYPAVPTGVTTGCVVRVIAARNFRINAVIVPTWNKTIVRGAVARYERATC